MLDNMEFIKIAVNKIVNFYRVRDIECKKEDVFVVWLNRTLQNNKALLSTSSIEDGRYFEFTHNGDKNEFYLDSYVLESTSAFDINLNKIDEE